MADPSVMADYMDDREDDVLGENRRAKLANDTDP